MGSLIGEVFGVSPFGPLLEHTKKSHECVHLIRPLMEALIARDYEKVRALQDKVSKLEYEADQIKHAIREQLPRRYFLAVNREDLEGFLHCQDAIPDAVEDFAIVLIIRETVVHESLQAEFLAFVDQIVAVTDQLMEAAEEMQNLAETSFGGAEAQVVLQKISTLGEEEWKADRMARKLSIRIYKLENELDPISILFYEKFIRLLSSVANAAENTGDQLRLMIVKGR